MSAESRNPEDIYFTMLIQGVSARLFVLRSSACVTGAIISSGSTFLPAHPERSTSESRGFSTDASVNISTTRLKTLPGSIRSIGWSITKATRTRWQDLAESWGRGNQVSGTVPRRNSLNQHRGIHILGISRLRAHQPGRGEHRCGAALEMTNGLGDVVQTCQELGGHLQRLLCTPSH